MHLATILNYACVSCEKLLHSCVFGALCNQVVKMLLQLHYIVPPLPPALIMSSVMLKISDSSSIYELTNELAVFIFSSVLRIYTTRITFTVCALKNHFQNVRSFLKFVA